MPVRVTPTAPDRFLMTHETAADFDLLDRPEGLGLVLRDAQRRRVAFYAPGHWGSAEKLPEPEPVNAAEPVASAEKLPESLVDTFDKQVRDQALNPTETRKRLHEKLARLAADGQIDAREHEALNAFVRTGFRDDYLEVVGSTAEPEPEPASAAMGSETVLSEAGEPFVSVSVTANDAEQLATLLRKLIREKGAKSFGLAAA